MCKAKRKYFTLLTENRARNRRDHGEKIFTLLRKRRLPLFFTDQTITLIFCSRRLFGLQHSNRSAIGASLPVPARKVVQVVFYVFMARFLLEKHTRGQNICSPVHKPVQPYRADCPHWRVGTAPRLCQIDACTAHDCRTEAIAVPPTRQAMRFPVIDFVAAGKFGASSETWRPTAFCTAIRRQSREKRFTLSTGNRARNRRDPAKNSLHFRYRIFFTLRRDGEGQEAKRRDEVKVYK